MNNKVWIVTGASQGLGLAVSKHLLKEGFCVCATSRSNSRLMESLGAESERFLPVEVQDIGNESQIIALKNNVLKKFGKVDVILNNAGYEEKGPVELISAERVEKNFSIDVFGIVNMMRVFAPVLKEQKSGYMMTISSSAGFRANAGAGIYAACKYAVQGICEAFYEEMRPHGVKGTVILPGGMNTNFHKNAKPTEILEEDYIYALEQVKKARTYPPCSVQNGDVPKIAALFVRMSEMDCPPQILFMGTDCMRHAREHLNTLERELALNREISKMAD